MLLQRVRLVQVGPVCAVRLGRDCVRRAKEERRRRRRSDNIPPERLKRFGRVAAWPQTRRGRFRRGVGGGERGCADRSRRGRFGEDERVQVPDELGDALARFRARLLRDTARSRSVRRRRVVSGRGKDRRRLGRVEPGVFELCQLLLEKQELLHSGRSADESRRFLEGQLGRSRWRRLRGRRDRQGLPRRSVSFGAVHVL